MEIRKIQKTGRNTFIVSLPKGWADAHEVQQGTLAELIENEDGTLQVEVHGAQKNTEAQIDANDLFATQKTISAYVAGAQQIVLKGANATTLAEKVREHLSAIDTIEERENAIVLRVYATGQEFALQSLLKRLHAVVTAMYAAAEASYTKPAHAAQTISRREKEANRVYTLALRSIGAERAGTRFKFDVLVANALENTADELKAFCTEKPNHGKDTFKKLRGKYEMEMSCFLNGRGNGERTAARELMDEIDSLKTRAPLEWARMHTLFRYITEIEDTTSDVAAIKALTKREPAQKRREK